MKLSIIPLFLFTCWRRQSEGQVRSSGIAELADTKDEILLGFSVKVWCKARRAVSGFRFVCGRLVLMPTVLPALGGPGRGDDGGNAGPEWCFLVSDRGHGYGQLRRGVRRTGRGIPGYGCTTPFFIPLRDYQVSIDRRTGHAGGGDVSRGYHYEWMEFQGGQHREKGKKGVDC